MKTLEELYKEVISNASLKKEFVSLKEEKEVENFLKRNGCEASAKEAKEFLNDERHLEDDELDHVAGGTCYYRDKRPIVTICNCCEYYTPDPGKENDSHYCINCQYYCETGFWDVCNNPKRLGK